MDFKCHRCIKKDLKVIDKYCKHVKNLVSYIDALSLEEDIQCRPVLVSAYNYFCGVIIDGKEQKNCRKWDHQWYIDRGMEIWKVKYAIEHSKGSSHGLRIMMVHIKPDKSNFFVGIFRKQDVTNEQDFQREIRDRMKEYFG